MMKAALNGPRKHGYRPRWILRFLLCVTTYLPLVLAAEGSSAAPLAVTVSSGNLYEFDLTTGEYWLEASLLDPSIRCHSLTGVGDTLFCTVATEFEGTWVRRLERSSVSVAWEVNFPDLDFPDGIAYSDSMLYVVAVREPRTYYLLTLDPDTGEELARIWLSDLGLEVPYALAAFGSDLWLLRSVTGVGTRLHRIDPLTGTTLESVEVPGVGVADDAEFGPDGRLWFSYWEWDIINVGWCTHYWMVPFLGAPAELQFSHCWDPPDPPPPNLANFTLANPQVAAPAVEIPTLGALSAGVLALLLALVGVLVLRAREALFRLSRRP